MIEVPLWGSDLGDVEVEGLESRAQRHHRLPFLSPPKVNPPAQSQLTTIQGYLAHKNPPPPRRTLQ